MPRAGHRGVNANVPTRDFLDQQDQHEERLRKIETGVHPVRPPEDANLNTQWVALALGPGWSGACVWRVQASVVQLRGLATGPAVVPGQAAPVTYLPEEAIPAWELELVVRQPDGFGYVTIDPNGLLSAVRLTGNAAIRLDAVRFPRG
jgi:hypothetical protein